MADVLSIEKINGLQHPITARFYGGDEWMVELIDVQTGLMRIDVCGKSQRMHFDEVTQLVDVNGESHDSDYFWVDD